MLFQQYFHLARVEIRTDDLLCYVYCSKEADGYVCRCVAPVIGEPNLDFLPFVVEHKYASLEELKSVASAVLGGQNINVKGKIIISYGHESRVAN